jgi:hypothetical protein
MPIEILIGVLVAVLAVATTFAAIVGIAGLCGLVRLIRCEHCDRLTVTSGAQPLASCVNCRHERVLHPIAVRHHRYTDGHAPRPL